MSCASRERIRGTKLEAIFSFPTAIFIQPEKTAVCLESGLQQVEQAVMKREILWEAPKAPPDAVWQKRRETTTHWFSFLFLPFPGFISIFTGRGKQNPQGKCFFCHPLVFPPLRPATGKSRHGSILACLLS